MGCKLTQNIKHSCDYNPGGIKEVMLLDVDDFGSYEFGNDNLFDECLVTTVFKKADSYIHLDVTSESFFTETHESGIYKQQLQTFVRTLGAQKTASLLLASSRRYIVIFSTYEGKQFIFGSEGGASVSFSQLSGQVGESSGYEIIISKNSIYPTFEFGDSALWESLLASETLALMTTEKGEFVEV